MFDLLGISPEEQTGSKFGFLLDALAMGAPPHGGIALRDRPLCMALLDEPFIRDTLAFPKNQAGVDPMSGAPTAVTAEQLGGARDRRDRRKRAGHGHLLAKDQPVLDRRGSRFVLEVLFLAALAAGLTLAKLRPLEIVGVMALGWLVVALLEWAAWRGEPHYGSGLPPRYYVPHVDLPPPQPLEQVYARVSRAAARRSADLDRLRRAARASCSASGR